MALSLLFLLLITCVIGEAKQSPAQLNKCNLTMLNSWLDTVLTFSDTAAGKPQVRSPVHVGRSNYGGYGIFTAPKSARTYHTIKELDSVIRIPLALSISLEGTASPAGTMKNSLRHPSHGYVAANRSPPPAYQRYRRPYAALISYRRDHSSRSPSSVLLAVALMAEDYLHEAEKLVQQSLEQGTLMAPLTHLGPWLDCLPQLGDLPHLDLWRAKLEQTSLDIDSEAQRTTFVRQWSETLITTMINAAEPWSDHASGRKSLAKTSDFPHLLTHFEDIKREFEALMKGTVLFSDDVRAQHSGQTITFAEALRRTLVEHALCVAEAAPNAAKTNTARNPGIEKPEDDSQYFDDSDQDHGPAFDELIRAGLNINTECVGLLWDKQYDTLTLAKSLSNSPGTVALRGQLIQMYDKLFNAATYARAATIHSSRAWNLKGQQYLVPISDFFNYAPSPAEVKKSGKLILERESFYERSSNFVTHHRLRSVATAYPLIDVSHIASNAQAHVSESKAARIEAAKVISYLLAVQAEEKEFTEDGRMADPNKPPGVALQQFEVLSDRTVATGTSEELFESYGDSNNGIYFRYHGFAPSTNPFECVSMTSFSVYRVGSYRQPGTSTEHVVAQRISEGLQKARGYCLYNSSLYQTGSNRLGDLDPALMVWSVGAGLYHGAKAMLNDGRTPAGAEEAIASFYKYVADCTINILPQLDLRSHKHLAKWYKQWRSTCLSEEDSVALTIAVKLLQDVDQSEGDQAAKAVAKWLRLSFQKQQLEYHRELVLYSFKDQFTSASVYNDSISLEVRRSLLDHMRSEQTLTAGQQAELNNLAQVPTSLDSHYRCNVKLQLMSIESEASLIEYRIPKKTIYRSHLGVLRAKSRKLKRLISSLETELWKEISSAPLPMTGITIDQADVRSELSHDEL